MRGTYSLGLGALALCVGVSASSASPSDYEECGLEAPELSRTAAPVLTKARESAVEAGTPAVRRVRPPQSLALGVVGQGQHGGALAGKTVYVSAGHGWTSLDDGSWRTQRGNTHDLVEDFISTEAISAYLVHYLRNMGAYVVPIRESDPNPNRVVVDDVSEGFTAEGGLTLAADGVAAYGDHALPLVGDLNPFTQGNAHLADANSGGHGLWTLEVPESGNYNVYVSYSQEVTRASDARYVVRHAGGETEFRVDQRRHGGTWVLLGRFYFEEGQSPEKGAVALYTDSADEGSTLSFDAVRIGGGVDLIDRGEGPSGFPMFEHNARYNVQLNGAPKSVYSYASSERSDDVGARSRFTAWDHAEGEDAVYIAWHTNAPDPGTGTSTFAYSPQSWGTVDDFTGVPGGLELQEAVHNELINDIRTGWDDEWRDRGRHTAYFGEVNPNHNPETPAILVEVAFHDTKADADQLREPRFRRLAARAMAQGVARYYAERDGVELALPSEPPEGLRFERSADGGLRLSWQAAELDEAAGDAPEGYVVYQSADGYGFDNGTVVSGTEVEFDPQAAPSYVRVTAINAGGESFPSQVLVARPSPAEHAQVLLVNGFDRIDGRMLRTDDLSDNALGSIDRALVESLNDGSYLARYAAALDAQGVSFHSVAANTLGEVELADYKAVLWMAGRDESPLSVDRMTQLQDYVGAGGKLLLSGSEITRVLSEDSEESATFVSELLGLSVVSDDAQSYEVQGRDRWDALGVLDFDDFAHGGYDARYADVFEPLEGSEAVLRYFGGDGASAGVLREHASGGLAISLGFPLEVVKGADARAQLVARVLEDMEIEPDPMPVDPSEPEDPKIADSGCGCGTTSKDSGLLWFVFLALLVARRRR